MNFIKRYGYLVFYVTEANGSIPLSDANIEIITDKACISETTDITGKCKPIGFEFKEGDPTFLKGSLYISASNHRKKSIEKIIIYPDVTIIQIVNLEKI